MRILVSGLLNTETTVRVRRFPIDYYPIDYPFFGVQTNVSGVAFNIAKALKTLGDDVTLTSMTGDDATAKLIFDELRVTGLSADHIKQKLRESPSSVVLYDETGKRQIYCDLKDIQETEYGFEDGICDGRDVVVACNINFNRPLLSAAKQAGKLIATDVHVLSNVHDDYDRDFMDCADILFLSDEGIPGDYRAFLTEIEHTYGNEIIVLGMGGKGALMYCRQEQRFYELPAVTVGPVINTVGAGDALFSAFIHYYAKGFLPVEALNRAQLFASAKIGSNGAAQGFVDETAIEALYGRHIGR